MQKITHTVLSYVKECFGDIELGSSILADKDGKRYVLAKMEEQVNVNFDQRNYFKYCSITMYGVKRNGELTKKHSYMYRAKDFTVTGEKL